MRNPSSIYPQYFGLIPGIQPMKPYPRRVPTWSWHGCHAAHKALGPGRFRSILERDGHTLLCADWRVKEYAVEPHQLTYWAPNAAGQLVKRIYTPDFVVKDQQDNIFIMEVKAKGLADRSKWASLEPYIREAYEVDHGVPYFIFTEAELRAEPRLSNCRIMLRFRGPPDDAPAEMAVRDVVAQREHGATIGEITVALAGLQIDADRCFGAVMRLALAGAVNVDLTKPFSPSSAVKTGGWQ